MLWKLLDKEFLAMKNNKVVLKSKDYLIVVEGEQSSIKKMLIISIDMC